MNKKPNIVFFFTDDQRFDTIAALGNKEIKTPNIDELVNCGTAFTQAHIPGGTVGAVCMPSRAMLHTSKTLFHTDDNGSVVPKEHILLGEALQEEGYRTFGTGKWHNGSKAYARSFTDGGEIYFGGMWDHWNVPAYSFDPEGKYDKTRKVINNFFFDNKVVEQCCDHMNLGKHSSELFGEVATEWIHNYDSKNPFFMYISFMAPHDPRSMPDEFLNMYDPETISLPKNFSEEHLFDYGIRDMRDEVLEKYPRTEKAVKKHIAEYYGMISHLDNELGKVINELKETGKYEDTIIIFAGDNGLALGQHGLMGKQSCYEHSIRVPLIFAGPGIPKNERRDTYAYLLDIFPTICELIGADIPETVEGASLVPTISNERVKVRNTLYFAYGDLVRAVKNQRYKLIEYRTKDLKQTQLFDIVEDICETNNLYEQEKYNEIVLELRKELLKYRDEWEELKHPIGNRFWENY